MSEFKDFFSSEDRLTILEAFVDRTYEEKSKEEIESMINGDGEEHLEVLLDLGMIKEVDEEVYTLDRENLAGGSLKQLHQFLSSNF